MTLPYITTDPHSEYPLEKGKRYFMDFDISEMPWLDRGPLLIPERLRSDFITTLRDRGHEVTDVVVSIPHDEYYPNTLRYQFALENPLPVLIIVAIAISIIAVGIGSGYGFFAVFKGIGELPSELAKSILDTIIANPMPVIGILAAFAIFILGRKL